MLVGHRSANHPQQVARRGARGDIDDRATTADVFDPLDRRFGGFTIDVAAAEHNTKVPWFYDVAADGLSKSWAGERVWCNPPYSSIAPWVRKAWSEHTAAECIVMLLPANRTEQTWWQDLVEPYRDQPGSALRCEFIPGRLRFLAPGQTNIGANERPPFGCCLLIWQRIQPPAPDASLFDQIVEEAGPPAAALDTPETAPTLAVSGEPAPTNQEN